MHFHVDAESDLEDCEEDIKRNLPPSSRRKIRHPRGFWNDDGKSNYIFILQGSLTYYACVQYISIYRTSLSTGLE